jgi:hypothetical protein
MHPKWGPAASGSGWVHPGRGKVVATGESDLLFIDRNHALTCPGCGQTGMPPADGESLQEQKLRTVGFYRHVIGGAEVMACCRCQQIQPFNLRHSPPSPEAFAL